MTTRPDVAMSAVPVDDIVALDAIDAEPILADEAGQQDVEGEAK